MKITHLFALGLTLSFASLHADDKSSTAPASTASAKKGGKQKGGAAGDYDAAAVVKKFDTNADGKLSLEEFSAMKKWKKQGGPATAAKAAFTEADANKDGFLTAEELQAEHQNKVGAHKGRKSAAAPATVEEKPADKK